MITIVMTTYFPDNAVGRERQEYARQCMWSLRLLDSSESLRLHRADDGSDLPLDVDETRDLHTYWETHYTQTDAQRRGIGASLNLALDAIQDLWLYTTDDWLLIKRLDLDGPIRLLRDRGYDLIRLGPIHPGVHCIAKFEQNIGWWLDLQQSYGGFAFATRPFIATKQFYDKVGPFKEMCDSYEAERDYAARIEPLSNVRMAYWGGISLSGPWTHVGVVNSYD
jgi:hypothetical protein